MVQGAPKCPLRCTICNKACYCTKCYDCHKCREPVGIGPICNAYTHTCLEEALKEPILPFDEQTSTATAAFAYDSGQPKVVQSSSASSASGSGLPQTLASTYTRPTGVYLNKDSANAFAILFSSPAVHIVVGKEPRKYNLHYTALLCSSYFRRLPIPPPPQVPINCDPYLFEQFIQFCYLRDYCPVQHGPGLLATHAGVYILGEYLGVPDMKNLALSRADALFKTATSAELGVFLAEIPAVAGFLHWDSSSGQSYNPILSPNDSFRQFLASVVIEHKDKLWKDPLFRDAYTKYPDLEVDVAAYRGVGSTVGSTWYAG